MQGSSAAENVCAMELERCLHVGLEVFLDLSPGVPNSPRIPARVRGWDRGKYVILGIAAGGPAPAARQGKPCVVRFMHEGEVWGFTALFAEEILSGGHPLVQLYWPSEVARVQVRKHERVAIETPCKVAIDDGTTVDGVIGDLSGGGCSLILDASLEIGAALRLSFRMPDGGSVSQRPVIIRNRRALPGRGSKYGCQFRVAEEKDHSIELFVARKIAVERGETTPHPQVLVLSRVEADVELAQRVLSGSPFEVVEATGILDLGYRLRTCTAVGILISSEQKELSAIEVLQLIRQSPGVEEMPLFVYGTSTLHDQAISMGATLCLDTLAQATQILQYLPAPARPQTPVPPATPAPPTETDAIAAHAPAPAESVSFEEEGDDDGEEISVGG